MATTVERLWCPTCNQETKAERQGANHLLHFLISLVTFWGWLPGWYYAAKSAPSNCTVCGAIVKQPSKLNAAMPAIICVGLWAFGVLTIAESCAKINEQAAQASAAIEQANAAAIDAQKILEQVEPEVSTSGPITGAELRKMSPQLLTVDSRGTDGYGHWKGIATVTNSTTRPLGPFVKVTCRLFGGTGETIALATDFATSGDEILPGQTVATELLEPIEPPLRVERFDCQLE